MLTRLSRASAWNRQPRSPAADPPPLKACVGAYAVMVAFACALIFGKSTRPRVFHRLSFGEIEDSLCIYKDGLRRWACGAFRRRIPEWRRGPSNPASAARSRRSTSQGRPGPAEGVEHDVPGLARIADRPLDQRHRLHRRVQVVPGRLVDEPYVALIPRSAPLAVARPESSDRLIIMIHITDAIAIEEGDVEETFARRRPGRAKRQQGRDGRCRSASTFGIRRRCPTMCGHAAAARPARPIAADLRRARCTSRRGCNAAQRLALERFQRQLRNVGSRSRCGRPSSASTGGS
jgi:hypothetical protein